MPGLEQEIKEKIDTLGTAFETFKKANDDRLKEIEKKGKADPLLDGKVNKANEDITKIDVELKALRTVLNRQTAPPVVDDKILEKHQQYKVRNSFVFKDGVFQMEADKEYKKAYVEWMRTGIVTKQLSVGSDPEGGFLVRPEVGELIQTVSFESSPFRQFFGQQSISTDALEFPTDGSEVGINWVGETAARNETTSPVFGLRRISVHELTASPRSTQKLLDDASINAEQYMGQKAGEKFGREEAVQFANGDGVAKPRGFLTYPDGTSEGQVEQVVSGSAGAFAFDGLMDLVGSLKSVYLANAMMFTARASMAAIRKLKDGQGQYLWEPGLQMKKPSMVLGHPIVEANDMAAIAGDALALAFGDFKQGYKIVDRIGFRTLRDPFTAKPFVIFDFTKRVGGDVVVYEALKIQKLSA